jgi:hypothetical protein
MKKFAPLFFVFILSACLPQPATELPPTASSPYVIRGEDNPFSPQPADSSNQRDEIILTSANLAERSDLTPIRNELLVSGSMPGTCNELRIKINPPDDEYQILIEVYSIADRKLKCESVFQQFEAVVLLGIYSPGRYTIWVNDHYVGDFISL